MMKKILLFIPLIGLIAGGCGGGGNPFESSTVPVSTDYEMAVDGYDAGAGNDTAPVAELSAPDQKKIIKTGRIGIQVKELESAKKFVDSLLSVHQGYYAQEEFSGVVGAPRLTMSVRIPAENYERFTASLEKGIGRMLYKEISARDVTEQYVDLETRLANKRSYLERYREILKRAGSIKEILEVEEQVRKLEEEIESAQGRLRYLSSQIAYSSLDLTLNTEYKYTAPKEDSLWERMKKAVSMGWKGTIDLLVGLLYLWPLWLIGGGTFLGVYVYQRRKRKN